MEEQSDIRKKFELLKASLPDSTENTYLDKAWGLLLNEEASSRVETGEPMPAHALGLAGIIKDYLGLGAEAVNVALLHEFPLHDPESLESLKDYCSKDTFRILEGMARIVAVRTDRTKYQPENFIKLLLTLSDDIRSTIIILSDKLHHLRQAGNLGTGRRHKLAEECSVLYVPIAHRLGLYHIKTEIEDLAMQILEPEAYQAIEKQINESRSRQDAYIREFIEPVSQSLAEHGIGCEIKSRAKSIPSIWNKMQNQDVGFDHIYDVFAVRIILEGPSEDEKADCWKVYSLVTDIYQPNPERLRDWISTPKASGYESLHTTVLGPSRRWVEVQIRTRRMDEEAEKGDAAHWRYKDKKADSSSAQWLKSIRELLENPEEDAFKAAHQAKTDLYADKIYVFTPQGDLRKLSRGATVLDFAFDIHTRIGSTCVGARVNDKNVTIKHKLENGDNVEILTSKNQSPKSDWLAFVATSKAKTRIKRSLRETLHKEASQGREILQRKLRNWKMTFSDEIVGRLLRKYKLKDSVELYAAVASEDLDLKDVKEFLTSEEGDAESTPSENRDDIKLTPQSISHVSSDILEIDKNLKQVNYTLATCCSPIYGDEVFGFVTVSKGITIHRVSCPNAPELTERYPYRIIKVSWKKTDGQTSYIADIRVSGLDRLGIMNSISEVISTDMKVNMRSITFDSSGGRFEGIITVNVFDTQHLEALLRKLRKLDGVTKAFRAE